MHPCKLFSISGALVCYCLFAGILSATHAQDQKEKVDLAVDRGWYKTKAVQIAESNPRVTGQTLEKDEAVIRSAEPVLKEQYLKKGFSDSDVQRIIGLAWMDYRGTSPNIYFTKDDFIKFASTKYGGLKVSSKPAGAKITVDGKQWSDETNSQSVARVGSRVILLTRDGCEESTGQADVKEGQWTLFHRVLKCKKMK